MVEIEANEYVYMTRTRPHSVTAIDTAAAYAHNTREAINELDV